MIETERCLGVQHLTSSLSRAQGGERLFVERVDALGESFEPSLPLLADRVVPSGGCALQEKVKILLRSLEVSVERPRQPATVAEGRGGSLAADRGLAGREDNLRQAA